MRLKRTAVLGAALTALVTVSGCGSAWGEDAGLPKAGDMAALERLVGQHTMCSDLRTGVDGALSRESADPAWGIEARAVCGNDSRDTLTLLSVSDMEKFQKANKKAAAEGAGGRFLLGQDFALAADDTAVAEELKRSGVLLFTCEKDFVVPDGYRREKLLVDGCALTDYLPV
ncbi:hypothetical protein [Streptomyces sp. NBC_01216]|uniref:hypothetical protein n=1 Tax=unclassified Streptomyces TaxID=2593676 RepID=UPI002E106FFF|nr:hypothetical protein OG393_24585 [Streptomyces sp. NBC_01216]